MIFCGDFGLGFCSIQKEHDDLLRAQKLCEERDIDCYAIRGNHDDPEYYNGTSKQLNLSRFKTVSDYPVIKSPEHNILCLGGAISTDRSYRINSYENDVNITMIKRHLSYDDAKKKTKCYWWEKEACVYDEKSLNEISSAGLNIDVICSHSAPEQCFPLTRDRLVYCFDKDSKLEGDVKLERHNLSAVLDFLKYCIYCGIPSY